MSSVGLLVTAPFILVAAGALYWNYRRAIADPADEEWLAKARAIRHRNILVRSWNRDTLFLLKVAENPMLALRLAALFGLIGALLLAFGVLGLLAR